MTWQEAIKATLKEFIGQSLQWGKYDCCQFVSRYVELRTGINHAARFPYDSQLSAARLLARDGICELISSCIGQPHLPPNAGDVVVCHVEDLMTAGISNGSFVWTFIHERGLCRTPLESVVSAWGV